MVIIIMVPNDCGALLHRTSCLLFDTDYRWLKDHGIKFSEFIRMVVHTRVDQLRMLPASITHQTVQIISYSREQQEKGKKKHPAPLSHPSAHESPDDARAAGTNRQAGHTENHIEPSQDLQVDSAEQKKKNQ